MPWIVAQALVIMVVMSYKNGSDGISNDGLDFNSKDTADSISNDGCDSLRNVMGNIVISDSVLTP